MIVEEFVLIETVNHCLANLRKMDSTEKIISNFRMLKEKFFRTGKSKSIENLPQRSYKFTFY